MIKSVAASLPTYVMSCFRLPKTITSKLTSAFARFWWSSNGESRGMHWMAWNKLCSSKSEGGLGFRDVDDFNSALLENRASISVWEDPWIPAQFPRPAKSNGSIIDPSLKVQNLIDSRSNFWNIDLLQELFDPEDVQLISALHLGASTRADSPGWHFTKTGIYTVKSGYHTARMEILGINSSSIGPEIKALKAQVWKVQCPPKLHHFLWQILAGCVPVTENLRRRGINCDSGCVRCGTIEETINHTLFQCHPARQIWALSKIPTVPRVFSTSSIYANLDHLFSRIPLEFDSSAYPWIIWYIWKAMNEKVFENVDKDPVDVLCLAEKEAHFGR
ncbi:putative reverse transcriptase zinc-binding domain-containing protein [Arabidopsis thaliana]